jgi:undecaprenyl-diphosphatase
MISTDLNVKIFRWIHAGAGTHPVVDGVAIFFAEGGPYFLVVLFITLWFFIDKNKKTTLLEATEAAIIGLMINQLIVLFYFHPRLDLWGDLSDFPFRIPLDALWVQYVR